MEKLNIGFEHDDDSIDFTKLNKYFTHRRYIPRIGEQIFLHGKFEKEKGIVTTLTVTNVTYMPNIDTVRVDVKGRG